jgi:hypothetical protein
MYWNELDFLTVKYIQPMAVPPYPEPLPARFALQPAAPNPFNPSTIISYQLPMAGHVSLRVYDTTGRLVSTLIEGWEQSGQHAVTFEGSSLASGVYLCHLQAGENTAAIKLVLLK